MSPLSRRDSLLTPSVVSTRQKQTIYISDPPIEIGGYQYFVPNGTAKKPQKRCVDTIAFKKLSNLKQTVVVCKHIGFSYFYPNLIASLSPIKTLNFTKPNISQ